jgi:hypothetical protein
MKRVKLLFTALLAAIVMAQPVLACCLVHVDSQQHDQAPEAPPCHGHLAETGHHHPEPESETDSCSSVGDCALTPINHLNPELKTASGTIDPDETSDHIALQSFGMLFATSPPIPFSDQADVEPFAHQTPISLKERLLI